VTVVNDNPEFLQLMRAILEELGGVEPTVLDGDRCTVEDIADTQPDVLFIDLRMADGTLHGWDLAVLSRAHDALRDVPLILCSGDIRTMRERGEEFLAVGNIHTLEKPFSLADVEQLVQEALGTRR
jgi:CheY-like chemotaxis protein